jgi:hypothetical protein
MLYEFIPLEERPEARHPLVGRHLAALIVDVFLAFRFSPGPGVLIITYAFSKGDNASEAGSRKACPFCYRLGVTSRTRGEG